MASIIRHLGRVISVSQENAIVEIISESACSACHAKGFCNMGDATRKKIDIKLLKGQVVEVGETVEVLLSTVMGMKAVGIMYGIPFLLLVASLFFSLLPIPEWMVGIIAFCVLAIYYFVVYSLRYSFKKEYVFTIEKQIHNQ